MLCLMVLVLSVWVSVGASAEAVARCRCVQDADCVASCSQCAVSREWYQEWSKKSLDCSDGCAHQGTKALCQEGRCVLIDAIQKQTIQCKDQADKPCSAPGGKC